MSRKYAAKVDANQAAVVAALRHIGASVQPLHAVGAGVPDLLVGFQGRNWLIEVKDGRKPPSERRLTKDQEQWHAAWRGTAAVVLDEFAAVALVTGNITTRGTIA
jgi:hypothetical protein